MKIKYLFILVFSFLLSACSLFSPVKLGNESAYNVDTIPSVPVERKSSTSILVLMPEANPAYNTTQMAYTKTPHQIAYFAQNRWIETPSQMLLPLIVQTLQRTKHFHAVVFPPFNGRYDYLMNTQVLEFQQDYTRMPATFKIKVLVQLIRAVTGQVVAVRIISSSAPIVPESPYNGVLAANRATSIVLRDIAEFTLDNV